MDKKYLKNSFGFSLLELTAVVAVIGLSVMLMAPIYGDQANEKKIIETRAVMESIRIAILGKSCEGVRGDLKFAGYVPDMGELPELIGPKGKAVAANGQPAGLWRINPSGTSSGRPAKNFEIMRLMLGWQGPYITPPPENIIKDAWNRPLIFTRFDITDNRENINKNGTNLKITSLGADGLAGGMGPAEDLQMIIRDNDYLSRVAGYIPNDINRKDEYYYKRGEKCTLSPAKLLTVKIYYSRNNLFSSKTFATFSKSIGKPYSYNNTNLLKCKSVEMAENGYFLFDQKNKIPRGVERLLTVTRENKRTGAAERIQTYKIHVAGSLCWLGRLAPH